MTGYQMNPKISSYLDKLFPNPKCELEYTKDYELLIAILLSAQTTDKRVNKVTKVLFQKYSSLEELSNAEISDLEVILKEIGTFRKKARFVKELSTKLVEDGYDKIPHDRKYLESLPGVGRKTVNVFFGEIYQEGVIAVDTHVSRVSKRLGLCDKNDDVLMIEKKLTDMVEENKRASFHKQMVLFGRYHCKAKKPNCDSCLLKDICNKDIL